jgi:hypothetical protein
MKNKRNNLFETNSSSVHAIVIDKHSYTGDLPDLGVSLRGYDCQYGWESDTYYDTSSKLQYLISCLNDVYWGEGAEEKRTKLKKKFEGLMSELGVESVEYGTGGVDHGYDAIDFVEFVLQDLDTLKRYLFSSKSYVVTGNDNDECPVFDVINQEENNPDVDIFEKGN